MTDRGIVTANAGRIDEAAVEKFAPGYAVECCVPEAMVTTTPAGSGTVCSTGTRRGSPAVPERRT